jgi:hypothetical protein
MKGLRDLYGWSGRIAAPMETNVGSSTDRANARYSADSLPRRDRMDSVFRLASLDSRAK